MLPLYTDVYSGSDIKGAWGLRTLVSGYTGPLVRIRDTNDNSEQDVYSDGADSLAAFTVVGSARVTTLYDQSGNSANLTAPTTARQPDLLATGAPSGRPIVKFDGTDDYLADATTGTSRPYMVASPLVFWAGGAGSSIKNNGTLFSIPHNVPNSSPWQRFALLNNGTTNNFAYYRNGTSFIADSAGSPMLRRPGSGSWGALAVSAADGEVYEGLTPEKPTLGTSAASITYPNATALSIGAGAGGDLNNNHFYELVIVSETSPTASEIDSLVLPVTAALCYPNSIWKIKCVESFAGSTVSIAFVELEVAESISGSDITTASTPITAYNAASGEPASRLLDGNSSNGWWSNDTLSGPHYIFIDFQAAHDIAEFRLRAMTAAYACPKIYEIFNLGDDGVWYSAGSFDKTAEGYSALQWYSAPVTAGGPVGELTSVSPTFGPTAGGTAVTLTGTGFTDATGVLFDADDATSVDVVSDTEITCDTPAHAAGTVSVTVQIPSGDATLASAFLYTDTPAPSITSITPATDVTTGGASIAVVGDNFTDVTAVEIGGTSVTSLVIVDDENITFNAPAKAVGTYDVVFFSPNGNTTETAAFEYTAVVAARITQAPALVLSLSDKEPQITQAPLLVLSLSDKPLAVTQTPITVLWSPPALKRDFAYVPDSPVLETLEWLTIISTGESGVEQRSTLRDSPRVRLALTFTLLNDKDREKFVRFVLNVLQSKINYPMHHLAVTIDNLTGNVVTCPVALSRFVEGGSVAIFNYDNDELEYNTVVSISGNELTLLNNPAVEPYAIAPVHNFRVIGPSISMNAIDGTVSFELISNELWDILREDQETTSLLTIYDGLLVLDKRFLANEAISEAYDQNVIYADSKLNDPMYVSSFDNAFFSGTRSFLIHREGPIMDYWRAVLYRLKGSTIPFLLPTWREDLTLYDEPIGTTFRINELEYATIEFPYLAFYNGSGYTYSRVLSKQLIYEGPTPVALEINLNVAFPAGEQKISFLHKCRILDNVITLEHEGIETILTMNVRMIDA